MPSVYSATFQPFTYEELATPLREATAAHQAQEEKFDVLMTDADKMRAFLKEDWQSYNDYKEYVDNLNAAAEDLARNGLTRQNRSNLLQLKRDYNGKIQAINAGILSRQNAIDAFNKSAKGLSSRYIGARPEDYSVDEYMYGNNPFKFGVDGSEIYGYADEQAKASTSRRYQEFTEGGKWRITEVGVDPYTTQIVMDKLRTGQDIAGDPRFAKNPRQAAYMQAVLNDMRDIRNNARETFGYGQFVKFDDNGDPVQTPNQMKFDSEIFGGLNKGIQYARESKADPYGLKYYENELDIDAYERKKKIDSEYPKPDGNGKDIPPSGFGLIDINFVNKDPIKAVNSLGLRKNENGKLEPIPLDITYGGKKMHFNSKLDAYRWAYQNNDMDKLYKERDELKELYNGHIDNYGFIDFARDAETHGLFKTIGKLGKEQINAGVKLTELENKILNIEKEAEKRRELLKTLDYDLSTRDYKNIADTYGFDASSDFSIDDIRHATGESMMNVQSGLVHGIKIADVSGTSAGSEGKTLYNDSDVLKKLKGNVSASLGVDNPGQNKLDLYDISDNSLTATKKASKFDDAKKIIERANVVYTTIELLTGYNGTERGNQNVPIVVFQDPEGNRVGVPLSKLGPEYELTVLPYAYARLKNQGNILTNDNRSVVEEGIAQDFWITTNSLYGKNK